MTTGRTLHNLHTGASVMDQESFAATIQEKSLDTHFDSISILLIVGVVSGRKIAGRVRVG